MIGDVIRAKKKLEKELLDRTIVKKLSARVKKSEAQNWTADSVVNKVRTTIVSPLSLSKKSNVLLEVMRLLSTRPHTTSNSNYMKYVHNNVEQKQFAECLEKVQNKGETLSDEEIKYLDKVKSELEKYLKRETQDFNNRKHKDVSEKMQSLREVNRLKVIVTALAIISIDFTKKLNDGLLRDINSDKAVAEERGKKEAEKKAKVAAEIKRIKRGDLTPEEYEGLLSKYPMFTLENGVTDNYWNLINTVKPPLEILKKIDINELYALLAFYDTELCSYYKEQSNKRTVILPREFYEGNKDFVMKWCQNSPKAEDIVDEHGKSYKKELEERKAEEERKRKDPANITRITEGNLTDEEYRTLLFNKRDDDFKYLAGVIKVLKPPSTILQGIKVNDLVFRIREIGFLHGDKLTCIIPSDMGDLGKNVIKVFEDEYGANYKKSIQVQDEHGNSYD